MCVNISEKQRNIDKAIGEIQKVAEKYGVDMFCMVSDSGDKSKCGFLVGADQEDGARFIQYMSYLSMYSEDKRLLDDLALVAKRWSTHQIPDKYNPIAEVTVGAPVGVLKYEVPSSYDWREYVK